MMLLQISINVLYSVSISIVTGLVLIIIWFTRKWVVDEENSRNKLGDAIDKLTALFTEFKDEMMEFKLNDREERHKDREDFIKLKSKVEQIEKEHDKYHGI